MEYVFIEYAYNNCVYEFLYTNQVLKIIILI
jgi:hypothetical protein